jgi:hypothetical protein
MNVIRRRFMQAISLAAGACLVRPGHASNHIDAQACQVEMALADKLTGFFIHLEDARQIGRAYLRETPDEADRYRLVELLCPRQAEARTRLATADAPTLRALLQEQMCRDFADGQMVNVNGLILSRTEGRLAALATLR